MKKCRDDHCSKSKETRGRRMQMESIFVLHIQTTIPTCTSRSFTVVYVYVGIVGWICRTNLFASFIPTLVSLQWSSLHFFSFHRNVFSLTCLWLLFFSVFMYNIVCIMQEFVLLCVCRDSNDYLSVSHGYARLSQGLKC